MNYEKNFRAWAKTSVRVPHLASHLLAQAARQLSADWERLYAHPVYLAGDLHRSATVPGHLLPGGQLDLPGADHRTGKGRPDQSAQSLA